VDIIEILLDSGAHIDAMDGDGRTPLQYGAERGYEATVEKLLRAGADLNHVDTNGMTALHIAIGAGRGSIVKLLIENGANPNERVMLSLSTGTKELSHLRLFSAITMT
ncbi:ankyrin, partial [Colletotrichum somersetense]